MSSAGVFGTTRALVLALWPPCTKTTPSGRVVSEIDRAGSVAVGGDIVAGAQHALIFASGTTDASGGAVWTRCTTGGIIGNGSFPLVGGAQFTGGPVRA
jgi:hypothetical protein